MNDWTTYVIPVTCVYDTENCPIPDWLKIEKLKNMIQVALRRENPAYFIDGKIIAVGPSNGNQYNKIMSCPEDFKFVPLSPENIRCQGDCDALVVYDKDPNNHTERILRQTDGADLLVIENMFMSVLERKEHVLAIAGDIDFLTSIGVLHGDNMDSDGEYATMLLARNEHCTPQMRNLKTKATWIWSSADETIPTMVRGGQPLKRRVERVERVERRGGRA